MLDFTRFANTKQVLNSIFTENSRILKRHFSKSLGIILGNIKLFARICCQAQQLVPKSELRNIMIYLHMSRINSSWTLVDANANATESAKVFPINFVKSGTVKKGKPDYECK